MDDKRIYLCIDLKSFYASVECVDRGLDSLNAKLVVADRSRGEGALCLAVSAKLKELGVKNRCRLFEIPKNINYICAKPRMKRYMEVSALIYSIYLKYIAKEDIHVYSIDECFLDVTSYLHLYKLDAYSLAKRIIEDVLKTTGICATAGIGTNMYLAKVALDISAKHTIDHIAYLDEEKFKNELWLHEPITDFWGISFGTQKRLLKYGITNQKGIALADEEKLYKEFGINAEILIDHSKGIEPCTIEDIRKYKPKSNSLSCGQVLFHDTKYEDAFVIFKEMVDTLCLELVEKNLVASGIGLSVGYAKGKDGYASRKMSGGSRKLIKMTNSLKEILSAFIELFKETTDKNYLIRRIKIGFNNVVSEDLKEINLFSLDSKEEEKERALQETLIKIKQKYGKNSVLKGMNYLDASTQRMRNKLIGGHNGGEEDE